MFGRVCYIGGGKALKSRGLKVCMVLEMVGTAAPPKYKNLLVPCFLL